MGGGDDALADFDVEAEIARALAELPDDWIPDAVETAHSYCSSTVAGGVTNRENSGWPAGRSAGQDHSGELLRPLHAVEPCRDTPACGQPSLRRAFDLRSCTAVQQRTTSSCFCSCPCPASR
jgi:hypothetical protein